MYDVIIIGAGIAGASVARELAKYKLNILILEKENDISNGTTKANSGIVHSGYDAKPNTLKAKFNVLGNEMMEGLCAELQVPFKKNGSLTLAFNDEEYAHLEDMYERGIQNGVSDMEILDAKRLRELEPNISQDAVGALYAKTAGIVGPWELAIALIENAMDNGCELRLNSEVKNIEKMPNGFRVYTENETFETKYIVNCAGVYADEIHNMVAKPKFKITPRRGQYYLLDKNVGDTVTRTIFQHPTKISKGVVVLPTVHGNLLVGPDAENLEDKTDKDTTDERMKYVKETGQRSSDKIAFNKVITSFAGLRASPDTGDFIIEEAKDAKGFIDVAGIESPGLTASPAIGVYIANMLKEMDGGFVKNLGFNPKRKEIIHFMELSDEEKNEMIKRDPRYGRIICRCENITEGEIVDVIHRNAGATTVDGIKRRIRPGSGRCQGGFCQPKVLEILARELGKDITEIVKDKKGSNIAIGKTK
ncbi:MAG: NAD(P)/FAD-dependent oxidoreductase [Tissierellia bacterium]|nr:NAD(P)/FAD-dependent oxidoreductase [Tissierellia bacterium]